MLAHPKINEIRAQCLCRQHVECGERFVHEKDVGMHDESASKSHPLPHATRKFARICTLEAIKADKVNRRQRARAHLLLRQAECFESKLDILEDSQPRKQRKALEDHGNAGRAALNPAAQVSDRAGNRSRETSNQTK